MLSPVGSTAVKKRFPLLVNHGAATLAIRKPRKASMNAENPTGTIMRQLGIDEADVQRRLKFIGITEDDVQYLRELHALLARNPEVNSRHVSRFYEHLLAFEETRALLADDATIKSLKEAQTAYFESLLQGEYDLTYMRDRLAIGVTHDRVNLAPRWYLGAYSHYLAHILPEVCRVLGDDVERFVNTVAALQKVVLLDVSLAMEMYVYAREQRTVEEHRKMEEYRREAELVRRQEQEVEELAYLEKPPLTHVTGRQFDVSVLSEGQPDLFSRFVTRYGTLLEQAVHEKTYKIERRLSPELRALASELGLARAGPRDVVQIHSRALTEKLESVPGKRIQFFLEEGRLVAFQLLGYLTSFYRNLSLRSEVVESSDCGVATDRQQE